MAVALTAADHAEAPTWAALAVGVEAREVQAREAARQATDADAVAEAREQVAATPESAEAWTELGNVLLERGDDVAGAIDAYQRALDLDPYALEPAQGLSLHAPGRLLPRIIDRWKELPDDERLGVLVATLIRTGHGREAAQACFRCRDLDTAWLLAGLAALAPTHCLAAIETRLALPGHDDDEPLRLAKADALVALGRLDEAGETLGALLAAGQEGWDLWPRLLEVDPKRVIVHFEARRPPPADDEDTRGVWGDALRRIGRAAEGRRVVAPFAAAHASDWPFFAYVAPEVAALDPTTWLPRVEARTRDPEENESPEPWVVLARAYELLGRRGEALRAWDEAIARDPDDLGLWIQRLRRR
jgi:tetratricopeptide (TPR) repeat protein